MEPIILTIYRRYLPGIDATGPVTSLNGLRYHLEDELEFRILSADHDVRGGEVDVQSSVVPDTWVENGRGWVYRMSPKHQTIRGFAQVINSIQPRVLYLNSFFDPVFVLKPLLALKLGLSQVPRTVIAVRGQFSAGALKLNAKMKWPYVTLVRMTGICKGVTWQASSDYEAQDIRRVMGRIAEQIIVAPNLSSWIDGKVENPSYHKRTPGVVRVLYLSRITPKKNLKLALRILSQVTSSVEFNIVGPVRDQTYWQECQSLIADMPKHVNVKACGGIDHNRVASVMAEHDLFFLPTLGENYGHVIAESLAVGTPVLIADTTPWRGLADAGVGWDLPLQAEEQFVSVLDRIAAMDDVTYTVMRQRAKEYARNRLTDESVLAANRALFISSTA